MSGYAHLSDEEFAAFVDGGLDADARQRVETHLVECDDCREVLASMAREATPAVIPRARQRRVAIGAVAAAAAVIFLLVPRPEAPPEPTRTRESEVAGRPAVGFAADAPADGATVLIDTLTFRWTPAGENVTYQLTVSTEAGAIVWSNRTAAISAALPDSLRPRLEAGRVYYWQVDAVFPNLRSASTGQRRLMLAMP
jgi:anti-sigma factor RsiW